MIQITEDRKGNVLVLAVKGRMDNANSDTFREHTLARIQEGAHAILVDFTETTYIASMGIRALFLPAQALSEVRGKMALCGLNPEIQNIFLISGVTDLFPIHPDRVTALKCEFGVLE